jgi:hypothetical protein
MGLLHRRETLKLFYCNAETAFAKLGPALCSRLLNFCYCATVLVTRLTPKWCRGILECQYITFAFCTSSYVEILASSQTHDTISLGRVVLSYYCKLQCIVKSTKFCNSDGFVVILGV